MTALNSVGRAQLDFSPRGVRVNLVEWPLSEEEEIRKDNMLVTMLVSKAQAGESHCVRSHDKTLRDVNPECSLHRRRGDLNK